jgi:large conductance mechanosensitive channel
VLKGFRDFIMRGNVIDLAVGIVIGAAFTTVVSQLVESFLNPFVKLVTGGAPASGTWEPRTGIIFDWCKFINAVIAFLLTAAAIYFFVVLPINKLNERRARGKDPQPAPEQMSDEVRLLTEIRDALAANANRPATRDLPPDRPTT